MRQYLQLKVRATLSDSNEAEILSKNKGRLNCLDSQSLMSIDIRIQSLLDYLFIRDHLPTAQATQSCLSLLTVWREAVHCCFLRMSGKYRLYLLAQHLQGRNFCSLPSAYAVTRKKGRARQSQTAYLYRHDIHAALNTLSHH